MTAINVVVVVALVFFGVFCVVALITWRKESKKQTDIFRSVERNLEGLSYDINKFLDHMSGSTDDVSKYDIDDKPEIVETSQTTEQQYGEISLDFIDKLDQSIDTPTACDTGRSGKKYTASELETLIKE